VELLERCESDTVVYWEALVGEWVVVLKAAYTGFVIIVCNIIASLSTSDGAVYEML